MESLNGHNIVNDSSAAMAVLAQTAAMIGERVDSVRSLFRAPTDTASIAGAVASASAASRSPS